MIPKNDDFDCVEMMHEGALRIRTELQGKTREEQLAYWRRKNEEARARLERLQNHAVPSRSASRPGETD